jgi:hypothetical protein
MQKTASNFIGLHFFHFSSGANDNPLVDTDLRGDYNSFCALFTHLMEESRMPKTKRTNTDHLVYMQDLTKLPVSRLSLALGFGESTLGGWLRMRHCPLQSVANVKNELWRMHQKGKPITRENLLAPKSLDSYIQKLLGQWVTDINTSAPPAQPVQVLQMDSGDVVPPGELVPTPSKMLAKAYEKAQRERAEAVTSGKVVRMGEEPEPQGHRFILEVEQDAENVEVTNAIKQFIVLMELAGDMDLEILRARVKSGGGELDITPTREAGDDE